MIDDLTSGPAGSSVPRAARALVDALTNAVNGRWKALIGHARYHAARKAAGQHPLRSNCIAIVAGMMRPTPPVGYGGVETTIYDMACDLRDRGWEVHLWGLFRTDCPEMYTGLHLHPGIDPDALEITALNPSVAYLAWPTTMQLRRLATEPRRVVIGEYNHPSCLPPLVADTYVRCMNPLFAHDAERAGYRNDRIISIWYWQRNETRYQADISREPWLLWVARPDRTKALEEAFRFAIRTGEELHFYAPWYPGQMDWAHQLERVRPPNVHFMGELDRVHKPEIFSRCRALLYTSRPDYKEAFGLIFLEALTSGTPVVALDHHPGSTQSILFPGPPFGLRAADTDRLAELWLRDREELSPSAVHARSQEIYQPRALADAMDNILRGLITERAKDVSP